VSAFARLSHAPGGDSWSATAYTRALRDIGTVQPMAGAANTLSALFLSRDYTDPWYASGAQLAFDHGVAPAWHFIVSAAAERQRSALRTRRDGIFGDSTTFRRVLPIAEGDDYSITTTLDRHLPSSGTVSWGGSLSLRTARFEPDEALQDVQFGGASYMRALLRMSVVAQQASHVNELRASLTASAATASAAPQQWFTLGGIGTLPGYDYRSFAGRRGAVLSAEATRRVLYPWVGVRAVAAAGATSDPRDGRFAPTYWNRGTDGVRTSAGLGLSLFWDMLHVDVVKGLNGGRWVTQLTFTRVIDDIG
jgi:hypothetical protein